jgi:N-acyl-D-aspartate/D-glutamate deacylase
VIANGRVVDPESKLDAVRFVGINANRIAAISAAPLKGKRTIDAKGLIVTAGFIDLHSHGQDDENYRYKAMDGVTTALEMEVGASPVAKWYASREGKSLINFGATVGHIPARMALLGDTGTWLPRDKAITAQLNQGQQAQLLQTLQQGLNEGAIGVGFGLAYVYGATREEVFEAFKVAAKNEVTCFVHVRSHGAIDPGSALEAMQEVIADAAGTGASLHIVHVTSTGLSQTPACLELIKGARRRGLDVTTEAYPYLAGMTGLETAIFSEGWQQKLNITYNDLQWVATGERLTAESFARYRQQGGLVVIYSIPEAAANLAVSDPDIMIASDGLLTNGKGHPRAAGSYARVLGHYVREQKTLSLMDALRKISLLPAQRLEKAVPMMRNKGRIRIGADADIVVFDLARVKDKATFENPAQYSEGINHVLVNGVAVVQDGKLIEGTNPGISIRRAQKK